VESRILKSQCRLLLEHYNTQALREKEILFDSPEKQLSKYPFHPDVKNGEGNGIRTGKKSRVLYPNFRRARRRQVYPWPCTGTNRTGGGAVLSYRHLLRVEDSISGQNKCCKIQDQFEYRPVRDFTRPGMVHQYHLNGFKYFLNLSVGSD